MRFTILEKENENEISEIEFDKFVKENCSQFRRQSDNRYMYRGISPKSTRAERFIGTPVANRRPQDMPFQFHSFMDNLFLQKFDWRARSSAIFCTGDTDQAKYYGTLYKIFPTDGFKFIWSDKVRDLFGEYDMFKYSSGPHQNNKGIGIRTDEDVEEHFIQLLKTYRNNNLGAAIYSCHEIMIQCDKYAAEWDGVSNAI